MAKKFYPVEELKLSGIVIPERFRKEHLDHTEDLINDIKENGMLTPIVVIKLNKEIRLVDGFHRYMAATKLEWDTIQCVVLDRELSKDELDLLLLSLEYNTNEKRKQFSYPEKIRAWIKIHEAQIKIHGDGRKTKGGWTLKDSAEFLGIKPSNLTDAFQVGRAMEYLPELKEQGNLSQAVKTYKKLKRRDEVQTKAEVIIKNVRQLPENEGKKKLIESYFVGDFFKGVKSAPSECVDLIEIDPPYGIELDKNTKALNATNIDQYVEIPPEKYPAFLDKLLKQAYRLLKPTGWMIFWYAIEPWHSVVLNKIKENGFTCNGIPAIWVKPIGQTMHPEQSHGNAYETFFYARKGPAFFNKPGRNNVYDYKPIIDYKDEKTHRTQRPISMMEDIIFTYVGEGAEICTPFAGSGNTILAANNLNCTAWGYDLSQVHKDEFTVRVSEGKLGEYKDEQ